jgi:hypothetical protein
MSQEKRTPERQAELFVEWMASTVKDLRQSKSLMKEKHSAECINLEPSTHDGCVVLTTQYSTKDAEGNVKLSTENIEVKVRELANFAEIFNKLFLRGKDKLAAIKVPAMRI